jgi:hypothetical protein
MEPISALIRQAIDNGSEVNAEGAYLLALEAEKNPERQVRNRDMTTRGKGD